VTAVDFTPAASGTAAMVGAPPSPTTPGAALGVAAPGATPGLYAAELAEARAEIARLRGQVADLNAALLAERALRLDAEHLAMTDPVTGGRSRAWCSWRMWDLWAPTGGCDHQLVALLLLDLSGFKLVNDGRGHQAGNRVLAEVDRRIGRCLDGARRDGLAIAEHGRYGGDEWLVLVQAVAATVRVNGVDRPGLEVLAERIGRAIGSRPVSLASGPVQVTAAIGVAATTPDLPDPELLCERADIAMYAAKTRRCRACQDRRGRPDGAPVTWRPGMRMSLVPRQRGATCCSDCGRDLRLAVAA
jgi:diguanylate cyclase (GGDEF)-like protein